MTMGDKEDRKELLAQAMQQVIEGVRAMDASQQELRESRRTHEELLLIHEARFREYEERLHGYEERSRELHARIGVLEESGERTSQTVQGLLAVATELQAEVARLGGS
ncbi:MAG: hypothetical protein OXL97_00510 [Chloroflexota bacterium]|nr:hypothetical protein [Chloroflexota bacterium]MDE2886506.1 hypothetical protein [Chloroflexota bacterium]